MTVFLTIEKIERNTDCSFSTMSNQILTDSRGDPLNYFMSLPPRVFARPSKETPGRGAISRRWRGNECKHVS